MGSLFLLFFWQYSLSRKNGSPDNFNTGVPVFQASKSKFTTFPWNLCLKKWVKHACPGVFSPITCYLECASDTKSVAFGVLIFHWGSEFGRLLSSFAKKPRTTIIMTFWVGFFYTVVPRFLPPKSKFTTLSWNFCIKTGFKHAPP